MNFNRLLIKRYSKPLIFHFTEYKSKKNITVITYLEVGYNLMLRTIGLI